MRRITRRALIAGGVSVAALGGAAVAIDTGAVPGRSTAYEMLGLNGSAGTIPEIQAGPFVSGSFMSARRGGMPTAWSLSYPPGSAPGDPLPLLVVLHGSGGTHLSMSEEIGLDRFLAQAVAGGATPFAIAAVDGGNRYWHPRAAGDDSGAMVTDEFLPLLADRGLLTERVALLGWSMGGYGALLLAGSLGVTRVASVVAESAAMWRGFSSAAAGAFDDQSDYDAHLLAGRQDALAGIPVRIDCGTGDGFYPVVKDYVTGFPTRPAGDFDAGGHTDGYWRRKAPAQLAFVAEHFA